MLARQPIVSCEKTDGKSRSTQSYRCHGTENVLNGFRLSNAVLYVQIPSIEQTSSRPRYWDNLTLLWNRLRLLSPYIREQTPANRIQPIKERQRGCCLALSIPLSIADAVC